MKLLSTLLILIACSTNPLKKTMTEAMNTDLKDPTRWSVKKNTIRFKGSLVAGDCKAFESLLGPQITHLEVNSQGGNIEDGLCIGQKMLKHQFKEVRVKGFCLSSCANYLFLAAENKVIEGIVGYHGNLTALIFEEPELRPQFLALARQERDFLKTIKVSQDFFDITQKNDKGMQNNRNYPFMLPGPKTFKKYGVQGVAGMPDKKLLWELQNKYEANFLETK